MFGLKWLPWRLIVSRLAKSHGFTDPVALLSRLHRFAQPSEVTEPIELLRAGVLFHARGLVNARSIQHNLNWIWPYWIERQFDPLDAAFIPRAFSITHVNLTHRNWTAVGLPDCDWLPIVDPRGLVTPLFDGWSIDAWIVPESGEPLLPSRCRESRQWLEHDPWRVITESESPAGRLRHSVEVVHGENGPVCRIRLRAEATSPGWLALAVRPANPEGVSFVHCIEFEEDEARIRVNQEASIRLDRAPAHIGLSHYHRGDVLSRLLHDKDRRRIDCHVGLATGAALFPLKESGLTELTAEVPLVESRRDGSGNDSRHIIAASGSGDWTQALEGICRIQVPDERMQRLFDIAVGSLVLHAPDEVYPGPYTYRRFWFRDAAFIIHGLLALGLTDRARRCITRFPERQSALGYFHSQEGEWDSNGEAIWIIDLYRRFTGQPLPAALNRAVQKGAKWIVGKRLPEDGDSLHAGLMPAGFSAEHLGPNDYYYWDDFWSAAGLRAAAACARAEGNPDQAEHWEEEATNLLTAVDCSLERSADNRLHPGIPASPYRDMDSGAVGSLAAGYPLRLWEPDDARMLDACRFMQSHCLVHGGFFQDMIHSGINAYLTLHLAQVLLRTGDPGHFALIEAVARLASPTGQWPEAIHPATGGGCMGDGQHIWAAAEWVLMLRNCFVREESDGLILASGLPETWLQGGETMYCGPAPTPFGPIEVTVTPKPEVIEVTWHGNWHGDAPPIEVRLAGYEPVTTEPGQTCLRLPHRN